MGLRSIPLLKAGPVGSAFLLLALASCAAPVKGTAMAFPDLIDRCRETAQKLGKLKPEQAVSVDGGTTADGGTTLRLAWTTLQGGRSTVCRFKDGQLRQIDGQTLAP